VSKFGKRPKLGYNPLRAGTGVYPPKSDLPRFLMFFMCKV